MAKAARVPTSPVPPPHRGEWLVTVSTSTPAASAGPAHRQALIYFQKTGFAWLKGYRLGSSDHARVVRWSRVVVSPGRFQPFFRAATTNPHPRSPNDHEDRASTSGRGLLGSLPMAPRTGRPSAHRAPALRLDLPGPLPTGGDAPLGMLARCRAIANLRQPLQALASHQRTWLTAAGFPRGYLTRQKTVRGFRTGDLVHAEVPAGKHTGANTGRVAIRASGSFNVQTIEGTVQGISALYCKLLQRNDGYGYALDSEAADLGPPGSASRRACPGFGVSTLTDRNPGEGEA